MEICKDKDRLTDKFVSLFKDANDFDFDESVKKAEQLVTEEIRKIKYYKSLQKLFDNQIQTLNDCRCPEQIIKIFLQRRNSILLKAAEMEIPEGHIPFVLVISRFYMGIYGLVAMMRIDDKEGYTLNPIPINNKVKTFEERLYCIYDVEDGNDMLGRSPEESEQLIAQQKRSCLTVDEGIAVCVYTKVLLRHYIDCTGSRYGSEGVPNIYLDEVDRPILGWGDLNRSPSHYYGSASCRNREYLL